MTADDFLNNFAHHLDAPNGISKLRELILQLAVQGKLVEQNNKDTSVDVLYAELKATQEKLLKSGAVRKTKKLAKLKETEIPFTIPETWRWLRLGEIGFTQTGSTPPTAQSDNFGDFIPFIKPAKILEAGVDFSGEGLSKQGLSKARLISKNSLLMVCIGGSIGKAGHVDRDVSCNQQINTVTPYTPVNSEYIFLASKSVYFQHEVLTRASQGTLPIISKSKWAVIPIPLPPLEEQKRIVEKVDELMRLTDKLEREQTTQATVRLSLTKASFSALTESTNAAEFSKNWQRVSQHFDELIKTPEDIKTPYT